MHLAAIIMDAAAICRNGRVLDELRPQADREELRCGFSSISFLQYSEGEIKTDGRMQIYSNSMFCSSGTLENGSWTWMKPLMPLDSLSGKT